MNGFANLFDALALLRRHGHLLLALSVLWFVVPAFGQESYSPPHPLCIWQVKFDVDGFPETITCVEVPAADLDFVAVKVGDVNGNAVTNRPESERPVLTLDLGGGAQAKGEAFTVPVTYTGVRPLEAFQMGLRFDPAALELLGPSLGDLSGQPPDHFGLDRAAEGDIRTLWRGAGTP